MPNLRSLATCYVRPEPRPLPSTGVTRLPRYYGPIRHLTAPGPSVTGIRLAVPGHAARLPVLRALSLCTCCRHYPGTATGGPALLIRPAISAFPERVVGSACASSFSRLARRSLALRPAHSRCHQFVARFTQRLQPVRHLPDCSGCFRLEHFAGWDSHPLESAALSRRTPQAAFWLRAFRMSRSRLLVALWPGPLMASKSFPVTLTVLKGSDIEPPLARSVERT